MRTWKKETASEHPANILPTIMIESLPPPTYSQTNPDEGPTDQADSIFAGGPQILIVPSGDSVNFQKGFLGAEGEHAAIEGELQVKTTGPDQWAKV